jgi:glycosyltransferase involved in cell wall biosynthesis
MAKIHSKIFTNAVNKTVKREKIEFDAIYGHFIMPAGFAAAEIGKRYGKPSFLAYGESSFGAVGNCFSDEEIRCRLQSISGVVAVSGKNRDELLEHGAVAPEKIRVFPNAIDNDVFRVTDKDAARAKIGIDSNDFVVAFVGHFINRKGSKRVSDALKQFDDVKSIFIGAGAEEPDCDNIIYKGRLPHDEIPEYLNAADVFVLPTLAEGCCNAIVEAMACGLPIISSNLPFNDDILDESNSIRIDPKNVDEIVMAISELKNNKTKKENMANSSLKLASNLTIDKRAQKILSFIQEESEK